MRRIIAALGVAVVIGVANLTPASAQKETANHPGQAATWTIDAWTIDESRSPIDGSPQVTATLNAVGYDARMSLRCEDKKTEANFFLPSKLLGSREYVKVLLRLPGGVETMLSPSTNDQSFFAGSAEQFIRQLPDSGTIIIRASGEAGRAVGGEFKLGNFSAIRQKIAQAMEVRGVADLDGAFLEASQRKVGAVIMLSSPTFGTNPQRIANLALRHRLPAITVFPEFAREGGLMAYGANLLDGLRQTGGIAAKVLKGAKPAELPVELPTRFELVINLKTAKALGLTVPPALLARADEVIE